MVVSGLRGSFPLTQETIDKEVKRIAPGVYALGVLYENKFQTQYVGRSDENLVKNLKAHIGRYPRFKFELYGDPRAAFEKECELFHFFKPKGNGVHPRGPQAQGWRCPDCGVT